RVAGGVVVAVTVGVSVGVLLRVAVGASGCPSQPPAHVSLVSKLRLPQPACSQIAAQVTLLGSVSMQRAPPEQPKQTQHIWVVGVTVGVWLGVNVWVSVGVTVGV